jgi:hypothetical protein
MNGLPTPRTTLRASYVTLLVWCKGGCQHQAEADLHRLVASGRGERAAELSQVPLLELHRMRCSLRRAVLAAWLATGPVLKARVRPRRVPLLAPEYRARITVQWPLRGRS